MRHGLLLCSVAVVAGLGSFLGCASSGSTTDTTGTGDAGGHSSTSSTSSTISTSTTSSTSSSGGGGSGGTSTTTATGTGGSGGMVSPGLPIGADCNQDSDCTSMLCKPVVIGVNPVCV